MAKAGQTNSTFPDSLRVGPFDYSIEIKEDMDPYRHLVGLCDHEEIAIWIKKAPEQKMREVLCHEIMHCILHVYGGGIGADQDTLTVEQACNAAGFGIVQFIRDNPRILKYIEGTV